MTAEESLNNSLILDLSCDDLPFEGQLEQSDQYDRESSFNLENLLDSEDSLDSRPLLNSETSELEDMLNWKISDLHWDDDQLRLILDVD